MYVSLYIFIYLSVYLSVYLPIYIPCMYVCIIYYACESKTRIEQIFLEFIFIFLSACQRKDSCKVYFLRCHLRKIHTQTHGEREILFPTTGTLVSLSMKLCSIIHATHLNTEFQLLSSDVDIHVFCYPFHYKYTSDGPFSPLLMRYGSVRFGVVEIPHHIGKNLLESASLIWQKRDSGTRC